MVWNLFVVASVPLIFFRVSQKHAMQLFNVIFSEGQVGPGVEHELHGIGIAGNLLFISRAKALDLQVAQKVVHLRVG